MGDWKVKSFAVHGKAVNAKCFTGSPDNVEVTWLGNAGNHPELEALLVQVADYIGNQVERQVPRASL